VTNQFDNRLYERDVFQNAAIYDSWLRNSNERDIMEQVFRDTFDKWCVGQSLTIQDIGCGAGASAKRLFKVLGERGIDFSYRGIDPYQDQLDRFYCWASDYPNVELLVGTIENYEPSDKEFDLGLAIHSLYYADDLRVAISKLNRSSKQAIIVYHGQYGINEVHERFRPYLNPARANIVSTYHDIEATLKKLSIPYKLLVLGTHFNIDPIKKLDVDGKNLVRFFLEKSDLSQEVLEEVSAWFRTKPDKAILHNVGYFFLR
jgi:SAM-dependent methyltransferase